jgi:hypothetical protein
MAVSPYLGFEMFKNLQAAFLPMALKMKKPQAWAACGCVL